MTCPYITFGISLHKSKKWIKGVPMNLDRNCRKYDKNIGHRDFQSSNISFTVFSPEGMSMD